jgi:Tfp pilus assembly protein PilF
MRAPLPREPAAPTGSPQIPAPSDDNAVVRGRAWDALEREDFAAARAAAQDCLRSDPSDRECFRVELFSYTRSGDFENARLLLEECLFDSPEDIECLGAMLTQLVRDRDLVAARRFADRVHAIARNGVETQLIDGQIADVAGDNATAIKAYEIACTGGQEYACVRAEQLREAQARKP